MTNKLKDIFGNEIYDELNNVFELSDLEEDEFVVREVRRKIIEKFAGMIGSLDNFLNPDSTYIQMFDAHALVDKDRNEIMTLIAVFGAQLKLHKLLEYKPNKEDDKAFCISSLGLYKENVDSVCKILEKVKISYDKIDNEKQNINYLG